ncbi:MAG: protein kinase [Gemmatimonadota bacterium]|nr:MAG: protein kinase [Gemmatimonadota bacterium]
MKRLSAALEDRYAIERELGRGGMATVFLAGDLKHGRKVAIKVLHPELAAVLGAERFLREIEIAARLTHPHILPLHDSGEADGFLYYVMPYVEGESLRDLLRRETQLPLEHVVGIVGEVADGLSYAHSLGVVHRDIKPENILLSGDHALVADFGIARAVTEAGGSRLTDTGLSLGTPHYMSPEQATGSPVVDGRSDVYALGCVAYEMLVGEPPHSGPNAQAIMAKVLTEPVPSVRQRRGTAPPAMEAAVHKALAKLPADRFATADQFSTAMQQSLVSGAAPGTVLIGERAARPQDRMWKVAAIAMGVVAVVAVALLGPWWGSEGGGPASVYRLAVPVLPLAVTAHAPSSVVALSPDGSMLAYVSGEGGSGQIFLRHLGAPTATPVLGAENAQSPFFSPDGQWLGFVTDERLTKVRLSDGTRVTICDAPEMHGASWGADGTIVFGGATNNRWGLSRVSADGGTPESLLVPGSSTEYFLLYPVILPDGDAVVFTGVNASGQAVHVSILSLSTGEREVLIQGGGNARYLPTGYLVYAQPGGLYAVRFDAEARTVVGSPVRVAQDAVVGFPREPSIAHFDVAANGTLVYVAGDAVEGLEEELVWVDRDGRAEILSTAEGHADAASDLGYVGPRVSPDGDRVLFWTSDPQAEGMQGFGYSGDIWLSDLTRGTLTRFSSDSREDFWSVWTPDGRHVVSAGASASDRAVALWSRRADGVGGPVRLTEPEAETWAQPYSFTADGALLFFQKSEGGTQHDIWVLPWAEGGDPRPVIASPAEEFHPAVSPDGRWLAYVSDESGRNEVYLTDFPGLRTRWSVSAGGGSEPVWAPDGTELFYLRAGGSRTALVAVSVEAGPTVELGRPEVLFQGPFFGAAMRFGRSYDVSPDGRRFLMVRRPERGDGLQTLTVVLNWLDELKELVGS